jgi:TRAP transporter 4TM/12TM fusion protein|tara:strand:- start:2921 stop:4966 length:2046 start_codon:yes stop_codon:yes gene_type:complete
VEIGRMDDRPEASFASPTVGTPPELAALLDPTTRRGVALSGFIVLFYAYHIAYPLDIWTKQIPLGPDRFVILSLALSFVLVFLFVPAKARTPRTAIPWYDVLLIVATLIGCGYMFTNSDIMAEGRAITSAGMLTGLLTLGVLLEGVRRTMGWSVVSVIVVFFLYAWTCSYWPGVLWSRRVYFDEVLSATYLHDSGMFGQVAGLWAKTVVLFMVFAGLIMVSGTGRLVMQLALGAVGHLRGGPAKVAVLASGGLGSLGPTGPANVALTGSLTIPLMKRSGYTPAEAGAIEAVSSSAGSLTPPVMGALTFFIADWLELPYYKVILGAILPAFLYYATLIAMVDFHARRREIPVIERRTFPSAWAALKQDGHYLAPIVLFVVLLLGFRWSVQSAVLYSAGLTVVVGQFGGREVRLGPKAILAGFHRGVWVLVLMAPIFAGLGVIMGSLELTGMPVRLAGIVTSLADGNLVMLLGLTAIVSYILGSGMPMIACYFILAIIAAPALIEAGIMPLAAHWFVIWAALLHYFTPPVMPMAIVGAAIAGASVWKTSLCAVRLGIALVIVPWVFVFNPSIMLQGGHGVVETVATLLISLVGLIALAAGVQGYLVRAATAAERAALIAAGLGIISMLYSPLLGVCGCALLGATVVRQGGHRALIERAGMRVQGKAMAAAAGRRGERTNEEGG